MAISTNGATETPQTRRKTVKTRILAISDTHAGVKTPFTGPLPKADVLIHSGDLTLIGKLSEHQEAVNLLKSAKAELKLVIPGNHDLTLDRVYCTRTDRHTFQQDDLYNPQKLQQIRELYEGEEAREAGIRYMEEGVHSFRLSNGAEFTVYASGYTPEFCGWAFPYERDEDRFNAPNAENPVPEDIEIDMFITHGPPKDVLDEVEKGGAVGCEHLGKALQRVRPRLHVFGHIHEARGVVLMDWTRTGISDVGKEGKKGTSEVAKTPEEGGVATVDVSGDGQALRFGWETLLVNASIMDLEYRPENKPWVVDLELPCA